MQLKTILKNNPDGVTFERHGLEYQPKHFKSGFMVSITDNKVTKPGRADILKLEQLAKTLNLKTYYFGYWSDGRAGYLDLSLHVKTRQEAVTIGQVFNQQAVFNCKTLNVVTL